MAGHRPWSEIKFKREARMNEFVVKDSGERTQFAGGMQRDVTEGKTDFSLVLDGPMFKRWAEHLTKGAKKYDKRNWMKAAGQEEYGRFKESALRHFMQVMNGDKDEDHLAAVFFNLNGMAHLEEKQHKRSIEWAAGLFEGEGSIVVRPERGSIQITLYSTDKDIIILFYNTVGVGTIHGPIKQTRGVDGKSPEKYKAMWTWTAYSTNAKKVLQVFLPYFGERRKAKAIEALEMKSKRKSKSRS